MSNLTYEAKPSGQRKSGGIPVWQPLQPLKPIELQNAGFVRQDIRKGTKSTFALWTVEEQQSDHQTANLLQDNQTGDDVQLKELDGTDPQSTASSYESNLALLNPEMLDALKQEAYDKGFEAGQDAQRLLEKEHAEKNETKTVAELAQASHDLLVRIEKGVAAMAQKPEEWHEPLKRLAMHLAEQLTLTELSIASNSIHQIIDRCIETLDVPATSALVVELNPNDMALLQSHKAAPGESTPSWKLQADVHLLPGSVRVRADDAVVSDLIENRLESLAHSLLQETNKWQSQTAFKPERLLARRGKADAVEDALPRTSSASSSSLDTEFEVRADAVDLSSLDLPDLNLSKKLPLDEENPHG